MCSHYQGITNREKFERRFGLLSPEGIKADLWPGYVGAFVRAHPHADVGDDAVPKTEALAGLFGLVPHWSTDSKITKSTYNARSETVVTKPSFRDAVKKQQRCIIPAQAIYEPYWRSGKTVSTAIEGTDGEMLVQLEESQGRDHLQLHDDLRGVSRYLAVPPARFPGFPELPL
jgi:putative SOS response-associated peptidase YedK